MSLGGGFFGEKILDAWENFERLKEIREKEKKIKKERESFFPKESLEDDESLNLGVTINNSSTDQRESQVHLHRSSRNLDL